MPNRFTGTLQRTGMQQEASNMSHPGQCLFTQDTTVAHAPPYPRQRGRKMAMPGALIWLSTLDLACTLAPGMAAPRSLPWRRSC